MRGKSFDELKVGDAAELQMTVTAEGIEAFARTSGDSNPIHLDDAVARAAGLNGRVAHGVLSLGFCSAVLGMQLPGPGTIAVDLSVTFLRPAYIGDTVTCRVEVMEKNEERKTARMKLLWRNQQGKILCRGSSVVLPPAAG
ncbi:MAG TPA: MaoC family dehydratase [bacterium]|nr:MaoC family dehydratase [bacterium]